MLLHVNKQTETKSRTSCAATSCKFEVTFKAAFEAKRERGCNRKGCNRFEIPTERDKINQALQLDVVGGAGNGTHSADW